VALTAIWISRVLPTSIGIGIAALIAFAGIVSLIILGTKERWIAVAGAWVIDALTRSKARSIASSVTLAAATAAIGTNLWLLIGGANFLIEVQDNGKPSIVSSVIVQSIGNNKELKTSADTQGIARFTLSGDDFFRWSVVAKRGRYTAPTEYIKLPTSKFIDIAKIEPKDWQPVDSKLGSIAVKQAPMVSAELKIIGGEIPTLLTPWGIPKAPLIVRHTTLLVGFDPKLRVPRWVSYSFDARAKRDSDMRSRPRFRHDPKIDPELQAADDDYRGSGFDRGHLISPSDARFNGDEGVIEANYLSTVVPQSPISNRTTWLAVENYTRRVSAAFGRVLIIAGPVFEQNLDGSLRYAAIGKKGVAVPAQLFRIAIRQRPGTTGGTADTLEALTFLVPNNTERNDRPDDFLTSIDRIERLTGLQFFSDLSPNETKSIKQTKASQLWPSQTP